MRILIATATLSLTLAAPAAAATNTVPVTLKVSNCDQCSVMATWSKTGKVNGTFKSKTKKAKGSKDSLTFKVPKGYWLYFTATSPEAQVDAASVLVTQYVGQQKGAKVTLDQAMKGTKGAYFCTVAKKRTLKATAGIVDYKGSPLLALWASPQLTAQGDKLPGKQGIKGVYGTQNTLPCA